MFRFVVTHLRWLARLPLLPQVFDAGLLTWTALTDRECFRAIEELEKRLLEFPQVRTVPHRFGGLGFAIGKDEFAHVHGNGLVDVRLSKALAAELIASNVAAPHHVLGYSAWVSCWLKSRRDLGPLCDTMEQAADLARKKLALQSVGLF